MQVDASNKDFSDRSSSTQTIPDPTISNYQRAKISTLFKKNRFILDKNHRFCRDFSLIRYLKHEKSYIFNFCTISLLSISSPICASSLWTNPGTGNWIEGSNWDQGTAPGQENVAIQNGGTAIIDNSDSISAGSVSLGNTSGTGTLAVKGGSLTTDGLDIGFNNTGTLIIDGGSVLSRLYYNLSIGTGSKGDGQVTVNEGGTLTSSQYLNVGNTGTGTLTLNSGTVQAGYNYSVRIGSESGSSGHVIVNGGMLRGSAGEDNFVVGRAGLGTLDINNNGKVTSTWLFVGGEYRGGSTPTSQGGNGSITLNDNSILQNAAGVVIGGRGSVGKITINKNANMLTDGVLYVGFGGVGGLTLNGGKASSANAAIVGFNTGSDGTLTIYNRGIVTSKSGTIAQHVGSVGSVFVTGDGSSWNTGNLAIGLDGNGTLEIENKGNVSSDRGMIGYSNQSSGLVTLSGSDTTWTNNSSLTIAQSGSGTLTISDQAKVKASAVGIGVLPGSMGTLNIGSGGYAGVLDTASVTGLEGDAKVNFNHINAIDFTPKLTGNLTVTHSNSGLTTFTAKNDYFGSTTVNAGVLRADSSGVFSANSKHTLHSGSMLDLNGFNQTLSSLSNAGDVKFNGISGTLLEIAGDYDGHGGTLHFNTELNDDLSTTDQLLIHGDTVGMTHLTVKNTTGKGALTTEGIKIIHIDGASSGTFNLQGDYMHEGAQVVVAGAHAYKLNKGGVSSPEDGHWYLRSSLTPTDPKQPINPEQPPVAPEQPPVVPERPASPPPPTRSPLYQNGVPSYEAYPQALLGLNRVSTLQQRIGNRFWMLSDSHAISKATASIDASHALAKKTGTFVNHNGFWGRIEGSHHKADPHFSTSRTQYKQNVFKLQAGLDGLLTENEHGSFIGGVFVQYLRGHTKTYSVHGDGKISTDGYGLGGSLTWYGNDGFYFDAQAHTTWYDSDLSSRIASLGFASGNNGFGYAFSAEGGKRFSINEQWSVTPQAQLAYSHINFNSFTDVFGAKVHLNRGKNLEGRLGIALDHDSSWKNAMGTVVRSHIYGIANLNYEFLNSTRVYVANTRFVSKKEHLWAGIGLGGSYNWKDDKYSIYGEGVINTSLKNFGNSHTVQGTIGFRMMW